MQIDPPGGGAGNVVQNVPGNVDPPHGKIVIFMIKIIYKKLKFYTGQSKYRSKRLAEREQKGKIPQMSGNAGKASKKRNRRGIEHKFIN